MSSFKFYNAAAKKNKETKKEEESFKRDRTVGNIVNQLNSAQTGLGFCFLKYRMLLRVQV